MGRVSLDLDCLAPTLRWGKSVRVVGQIGFEAN